MCACMCVSAHMLACASRHTCMPLCHLSDRRTTEPAMGRRLPRTHATSGNITLEAAGAGMVVAGAPVRGEADGVGGKACPTQGLTAIFQHCWPSTIHPLF